MIFESSSGVGDCRCCACVFVLVTFVLFFYLLVCGIGVSPVSPGTGKAKETKQEPAAEIEKKDKQPTETQKSEPASEETPQQDDDESGTDNTEPTTEL